MFLSICFVFLESLINIVVGRLRSWQFLVCLFVVVFFFVVRKVKVTAARKLNRSRNEGGEGKGRRQWTKTPTILQILEIFETAPKKRM